MFRVAEYQVVGLNGIRFSSTFSAVAWYWTYRKYTKVLKTRTSNTMLKTIDVACVSSLRRPISMDSTAPREARCCIVESQESKRLQETTGWRGPTDRTDRNTHECEVRRPKPIGPDRGPDASSGPAYRQRRRFLDIGDNPFTPCL